jgi:hydroxymethylbilane synthase
MLAKIILGTRGSQLARAQASLVEKAIRAAYQDVLIETKVIATRGDNSSILDVRTGRKGLFTAEIEQALLRGEVNVAVHSAKDLPSETRPEAQIAAVLPRASILDALISKHAGGLDGLPNGATVATGSVRRLHQLHWKRADLTVVDVRGNVPTRLRKLAENDWDGVVLAHAGLERLGLSPAPTEVTCGSQQFHLVLLPWEIFLPAGGQGIIALQTRCEDQPTKTLLEAVTDRETLLCLMAEREFLHRLHGDCNFPVGVHASIKNGQMKLRAQLFGNESLIPRQAEIEGPCDSGHELAAELLRRIGEES